MLLVHRDAQERLEAVLEWWLVNDDGRWDAQGRWVFCNQLAMTPGVNGFLHIQRFIDEIATGHPQTVGAYWERRDKSRAGFRTYRREQLCQEVWV